MSTSAKKVTRGTAAFLRRRKWRLPACSGARRQRTLCALHHAWHTDAVRSAQYQRRGRLPHAHGCNAGAWDAVRSAALGIKTMYASQSELPDNQYSGVSLSPVTYHTAGIDRRRQTAVIGKS